MQASGTRLCILVKWHALAQTYALFVTLIFLCCRILKEVSLSSLHFHCCMNAEGTAKHCSAGLLMRCMAVAALGRQDGACFDVPKNPAPASVIGLCLLNAGSG
jgi:hypothetical protein